MINNKTASATKYHEISFNKLNQLIEDTENIIISKIPNIETIQEFETIILNYNELYGTKSEIVKGITSTIKFKNLLEYKLNYLILLSKECSRITEHIQIPRMIENDDDSLIFIKKSFLQNQIKPTIEFVIDEIKLCLSCKTNKSTSDLESNTNIPTESTIKTLNWQGTPLELTELIKSLLLSNKINPELTQKDVFNRFREFFNVDDFNENDKIRDIKNRTNMSAPFINKLEIGLTNWITNKD